jgi:3-deoxy-7-phosphoheptulonate synthase
LAEVRELYGLKIVTEALDEYGIDQIERYGDVIQIGARNMQNFSLLRRAGRSHLPVLLKRGMSATLDEWLLAAELHHAGRQLSGSCCVERGMRRFRSIRGTPWTWPQFRPCADLTPASGEIDPSHGTGKKLTW